MQQEQELTCVGEAKRAEVAAELGNAVQACGNLQDTRVHCNAPGRKERMPNVMLNNLLRRQEVMLLA